MTYVLMEEHAESARTWIAVKFNHVQISTAFKTANKEEKYAYKRYKSSANECVLIQVRLKLMYNNSSVSLTCLVLPSITKK